MIKKNCHSFVCLGFQKKIKKIKFFLEISTRLSKIFFLVLGKISNISPSLITKTTPLCKVSFFHLTLSGDKTNFSILVSL